MADGSLTAARRPYKRKLLALGDIEVDAPQNVLVSVVGIYHILKFKVSSDIFYIGSPHGITLGSLVHYLKKSLKARNAVLVLLHKVYKRHNGTYKQVYGHDKGGIVAEKYLTVIKKQPSRYKHYYVEDIGDKRRSRMKAPHRLVCVVTRHGKAAVALLKFLLFLFCVVESLCHSDA